MKKSIIAAIALLGGVAIAAPMLAWSADPTTQDDQPASANSQIGGSPTGGPGMGGMGQHEGWRPMADRWAMRASMWHHAMRMAPGERCEERLARRAAAVAYTITKLDLTTQQKPLWDKVNSALQSGAEKQQQLCAALTANAHPEQRTVLDRVARHEQVLAAKLQTLQQVEPALQQLYQALTPAQKAIIENPFQHG